MQKVKNSIELTEKQKKYEGLIALLPMLLQHRIAVLRMDQEKFEPFEGDDIRLSYLAFLIWEDGHTETPAPEVLENYKAATQKLSLEVKHYEYALALARSMAQDEANGIDILNPVLEDLMKSETMRHTCVGVVELKSKGYVAQPRKKFIQKYINSLSQSHC